MKFSLERITPILANYLKVSPDQLRENFRPASETDFDDVVKFRANYFNEKQTWDDKAYLKWRFDFKDKFEESSNVFWILKIEDEIFGVIGVERFELMVKGIKNVAYHPSDLLVKPSVNGLGLGVWLNLMIIEKYPIVVTVGSTKQSLGLIKKIYQPVSNCHIWKYPLSIKGTTFRKTHSDILARFAALFFDWVLVVKKLIDYRKFNNNLFRVKRIERFDDSVTKWSDEFKMASSYRVRDRNYLNWRFLDNPRNDYAALGLYNDDELIAYSIYDLRFSELNKQLEATIADFFWKDKNNSNISEEILIGSVLKATINNVISEGAKIVKLNLYSNELEKILEGLGFRQRGEGDIFAISAKNKDILTTITDKNSWLLTGADTHGDGQ